MSVRALTLVALLSWITLAFGGVYDWAFLPAALTALAGGATVTLHAPGERARTVNVWLLVTVLAALAQLIPVPAVVRSVLSPGRATYLSRTQLLPALDGWQPLSLYPEAWLFGVGTFVAAIAVFVWTRDGFESRGVRQLVRGVVCLGSVVGVYALVQPTLFPNGRIYGFWVPIASSAHPVGPIVSRNHYAAWIVLVWPLAVGYLVAHGRTHWQQRRTSRGAQMLGDARAIWLMVGAAFMAASMLVTVSRAGVLGFGAAVVVLTALVWRRTGGAARAGLGVLLVAMAAAASLWASPDALLTRVDRAYSGADGSRPMIWAQTMTLVREFPLTGIGLGTFDVVMPAYQTQGFETLLNHAHNQYLHIAAEGGALVGVPLTIALAVFSVAARRRLRSDRTPMVHIRHGAVAGLAGLAVLSLFEVPLLTPAVALLAAVSAGLIVRGTDSDQAQAEDPG